jgi:5-hydroxyisourate hydrolase
MATYHLIYLNSVNGTHASGVKVIINQINSSGEKKIFFETETDNGGRILKDFESFKR